MISNNQVKRERRKEKMKGKLLKKLIAGAATLAMAAQFTIVLPAHAEIVRSDLWQQTFENYTASGNTEVVTDPTDENNKVLKISSNGTDDSGTSVNFADFGNTNDVFKFEMDINFPVDLTTGKATKDVSGAYVYFGQANSTALKVYGAAKDKIVPFGYSYGGGSGQSGKTVDLTMGKWYTILVNVDKSAGAKGTMGFTIYDRDDYAEKGTEAKVVGSKSGMGFRNGYIPNQLIVGLQGKVSNEYFYIDNLKTFTEEDPDAENELKSVTFKTTPGATITPPAGDKEEKSYPVELEIKGTKGDLTADECDSITWKHIGTEKDDDYVGWNFDDNKSSGSIVITNGVSTYYCILTATVTKGDNTIEVPYKFIINPGTKEASQVYPAAGYPVDMNEYPDSLIGYQIPQGDINTTDLLMAKWANVGSNGARTFELKKDTETGNKYLEIDSHSGSGSTVAGVTIGKPTSQVIFTFDAKMKSGSTFVFANYTSNNPANEKYRSAFDVSFDGSKINSGHTSGKTKSAVYTANEATIPNVEADKWYKFVISYDITIQEYYVKVYSEDGKTLIGSMPLQTTNEDAAPTIFSVGGGFPTAIKNFKVYKPTVASLDIDSSTTTVKVPEANEAASTLDLSATMKTDDGLDVTGNVEWSFENGEVAGATLQSIGSQRAQLTVTSTAASGDIVVVASKDGKRATKTIKLTSSSNNVAFTKSVSSVTIPFDGEVVSEFSAETRTGKGEPIEGTDTITYRLLDSTGTKDANLSGVTFKDGKLTVKAEANPGIVYVQAENAEGLTNRVKVNIHGMSFSFGTAEPEDGYTPVTSSNIYNDKDGYGFSESTGLTDAENSVSGTSAYTVKVKVPNGNYKVKVSTTAASMTSENVSGAATGTTKTESEFNVAVCDDVLDLTFPADSSVTSLQISQIAKKTANEKPAIFSIGDSTTKNAGHYSKYKEDKEAQKSDPNKWVDERLYASWGNCVTEDMYSDDFSSYQNHGMAGRNSANYYNQGRLEAVLLAIAPGDYVTINMGINSATGEPYEELMENYYVKGVIQRGAIPVILTHTPQGPVGPYTGNYDETTGKFNCARVGDVRVDFLKSLATKYNLNLIDVATWGNNYLNSLTLDDLPRANTANSVNVGYTEPTTVYDLVASWYPDWNHYTSELGSVYASYIMSELTKIKNSSFDVNSITQTAADGVVTFTAQVPEEAAVGSKDINLYVAQYDANNVLIDVQGKKATFTNENTTATVSYTKKDNAVKTKAFAIDNDMKTYMTTANTVVESAN